MYMIGIEIKRYKSASNNGCMEKRIKKVVTTTIQNITIIKSLSSACLINNKAYINSVKLIPKSTIPVISKKWGSRG